MKFGRSAVENKGWAWWLACAMGLCLLTGAIAYWSSIWFAPAVRIAPAGSLSDQSGPVNLGQAQGLFGQVPASAPIQVVAAAPSNIKVLGIVAAGAKGSAILAIDGKPAKVYAVGDKVDGENLLLGVDARQVTLGASGKTNKQFLPVPVKPELSVLTQGATKTGVNGSSSGTGVSSGIPPNNAPFGANAQTQSLPTANAPISPPPASIITPPPPVSPQPPSSGMAPGTQATGLPSSSTWANPVPNTGVNLPSPSGQTGSQ